MTHLTGKYFYLTFNEGTVKKTESGAFQFYKHLMNIQETKDCNWLAYAPYNIIGLASELTEEEWIDIVESSSEFPEISLPMYQFYDPPPGQVQATASPKTSGLPLLKSKSLKPETTLIILKG